MTGHVPFNACSEWSDPSCGNKSNDPLVDKMIGNAYHVVRSVYCKLDEINVVYALLDKYKILICVSDPSELPELNPVYAKYARVYSVGDGSAVYYDYIYTPGNMSGIPTEPATDGTWVQVNGPGNSMSGNIPWVYNGGSSVGGETTIVVPSYAIAVSELFINGSHELVDTNVTYNAATRTITFEKPLEAGEQVVVMIQSNNPGNLHLDMGVI